MNKINIAHIHVWDKKNKGDYGIVLAVQDLLRKKLLVNKINEFPVEVLKKYNQETIKKINQNNVIILGGGGVIYRFFLPYDLKVISSINKPFITFGIGYIKEIGSKNLSFNEKKSVTELVKKTKIFTVRDIQTKKELTSWGAEKNKIEVIGDPAVLLDQKGVKNLKLKKNNLNIIFNLNYSGWLGFGSYEKRILDSYQKFLSHFSKKGANIYYALHHPDELKILKKINIQNIKTINLPPREQKNIYGKMDLMVGMMLHSCVMSFGALTPFINVGYDIRNKGFGDYIGHPELIINADTVNPNKLIDLAQKILKNKNLYKKSFSYKINNINKNFDLLLDKINSYAQL